LKIALGYNRFYSPTDGNYLEVDIKILSNSVHYVKNASSYHAEVEFQIVISKNDTVYGFDKYRIKSVPLGDSIFDDFYTIKRFPLKPNDYLIEVYALDVNSEIQDTIRYRNTVNIPNIQKDAQFSDIEWVEYIGKSKGKSLFEKSGNEIVPRILNYYNNEASQMIYYAELYNTTLLGDSQYVLKYYIAKLDEKTPVNSLIGAKRIKSAAVIPIVQLFDISTLNTGQYEIVLELLSVEGILLREKRSYFDRYSLLSDLNLASSGEAIIDPVFQKDVHSDSLYYFLSSLNPMSSLAEQEKISELVKSHDSIACQKYFQAYWLKTNSKNPTEAWVKYKALIKTVEENYGSSNKFGFDTDRGRILIKYGVPNTIVARPNDPNQYPYEIWHYYKINNRNDVRFVFYNPRIVGNDYELLHSDMPSERYNDNWQSLLFIQKGGIQTNGSHTNDMNILNSPTDW
jgi:GWxTD domain-containing protein